jgi:hypothetical protein
VYVGADRLELFDNEPPARRRLQRDLKPLAGEAPQKPTDTVAVRGRQRARLTSPVSVFSQSAVICARCWSSPITIATRGLLTLHG